MRPRRSKVLDQEPTVFEPATGEGGGQVLIATGGSRDKAAARARGTAAPGETGEEGAVVDLADLDEAADADALRRAREIAAALAIPQPPRRATARRGLGDLESLPFAGAADDIDLEATIDNLVSNPVPDARDIVVRERIRQHRAVVLVIDVSGSMRGDRVRSAAAAVGALVGELVRDDLAVIAFWSDAAILAPMGRGVPANQILDLLVRIPARGLTNVELPLRLARDELAKTLGAEGRVLLLSDCVHNAGPDPRSVAATLPRLDVLLDTSGEKDAELGRDLARLGRGRLETVRTHRDLPAALSRILGP
ncbi:VWA domain-containing protein [Georgenia sp. TF02-10]|uniref:vWA domain-containing protein n=1 Tax=Georgenia sp. TF02-10 TaxID=2917725 RepID=UPI001FA7B37E|nr:VWA domain-containing protein [Georgenia sp. TF02-10]UNX54221.1 VWA domain-containing protein [Georgenia sp. TF02-10]